MPAETWAASSSTAPRPVQGFSAILDNGDGTFLGFVAQGAGAIRGYRIRAAENGVPGADFIELRDPDRRIPFAIVNHFTTERVLTGADFGIESIRRATDGSLWFGDEFGPFLLHTDAAGRVLEAPQHPGVDPRSQRDLISEESAALRVMHAVRAHARRHGNSKPPVFSPWNAMIADGTTVIANRQAPPAGSGLAPASSDIFNVALMRAAGYPIVTWTVNDKARMLELMRLGVTGIISDRPDILFQAVSEFDGNGDGVADFVTSDGLVDLAKFDAQGHRGGRDLRPENTLPAMEAALDHLMSTLEMDCGVTADGVPVLDHDPVIESGKARRADGTPYSPADEVLVKDLTLKQIQGRFIADKLFRGPLQRNDPKMSPVTAAYAEATGLPHLYSMPSIQQVFEFVEFYEAYYKTGVGRGHADAARRWKNAARVRFNIETKINPRAKFLGRTTDADSMARAVAGAIAAGRMEDRADIQSFDFRTLLRVHVEYPSIRTVFLFGDFPIFDDPSIPGSYEGTNLQPEGDANTPWLAGLPWPYRSTRQ
jgi:glycerophosphoryl diester phosphodiesterase